MKKIILIILIAISTCSYGQELTVTPNGLRNLEDIEKSFVVLNIEGKTSQQLYDKAISFVNLYYKSPVDVIKGKIEGEFVKYITHVSNFLVVKRGGKMMIDADYTIQLNFKDHKVKFEVIELTMHTQRGNYFEVIYSGSPMKGYPIYDKKGKLKMLDAKDTIETYFNLQIKQLKDYLAVDKPNDNW